MTARSDPPSPDTPGASRPRSGPADVPVALLVAAQRGDPGAFARVVEHWDRHLRPFVHLVLGASGSTERVLGATYVSAYRALPRYRADRTPGLWLHRLAFLAASDELRRLGRDPRRRRPRTGPEPPPPPAAAAADDDPAPPDEVVGTLRRLAPDQRALLVMVDLEGFLPAAVADAFDTAQETATDRLAAARRALDLLADPAPVDPAGPPPEPRLAPAPEPDAVDVAPTVDADPFAVPAWAEPAERAARAEQDAVARAAEAAVQVEAAAARAAADARDRAAADDQARRARILASVPVPAPTAAFWPDLGRRLLAERERPAAPSIDPAARLARVHPAADGFVPSPPRGSVETLADQADRRRPRRRWGRPLAIAAAVLVVAGLVAVAVSIGLSGRTPDGSVSDGELASAMSTALSASRYLRVDVRVDEAGPGGKVSTSTNRLTLGEDGSWSAGRTDAIDQATFDGVAGTSRHITALAGSGTAPASVLGSGQEGLAAGPPDGTVEAPGYLHDLQSAGNLLRSRASARAPATHLGAMRTWTAHRTVGTGPDGAAEAWEIEVRRSDGLPVRIERRRDGDLVRRVRLSRWTPISDLPDDAFSPSLPVDAPIDRFGFLPTDLPAVAVLGRGQAITPASLPDGYELTAVFVRGEAPAGARSTGGGANPPDRAVMSIAYQRGPERITVTTRAAGDHPAAWRDPFAAAGARTEDARTRTLGDGRFNQSKVQVSTDARGRARLWGVADGTVFTVAGDLTEAEAIRVAASLR